MFINISEQINDKLQSKVAREVFKRVPTSESSDTSTNLMSFFVLLNKSFEIRSLPVGTAE